MAGRLVSRRQPDPYSAREAGQDDADRFDRCQNRDSRELTSLDWKNPPRKMDLSPDGRFIVYDAPVAEDQAQHDINLLASDGSRKTTLVEDAGMDYGPMWTPDGKHILFVSDRKGTLDLWALPMDGDKPLAVPRLIR